MYICPSAKTKYQLIVSLKQRGELSLTVNNITVVLKLKAHMPGSLCESLTWTSWEKKRSLLSRFLTKLNYDIFRTDTVQQGHTLHLYALCITKGMLIKR